MELDELQRRILHRQELERLESMPPKSYNPSEGLSPEEMSRYIQFLFEQIQQKDVQHKELLEQIAGIKGELQQANSEKKRLNALILSLTNQLNEALQANNELTFKLSNLEAAVHTRLS